MTTTGRHQRDVQPSGGPRRRLPRTLAMLGLLAAAAAGGTWAEVNFAGRIGHRITADGASQDSLGVGSAITAPGLGGAGQAQVDDVLPAKVDFPATATSPSGYHGTRYAVGAGTAGCDPVVDATAPVALTTGCAGYLTADYVREDDHAVYTSVTVLYYPDPASAAKAAKLLKAPLTAAADLVFRQPGSGLPVTVSQSAGQTAGHSAGTLGSGSTGALPDLGGLPVGTGTGAPISGGAAGGTATATPPTTPSPSATASEAPATVTHDPDNAATQVRIAAVGRAVTVVQSAFADGRPVNSDLDTPTWYLVYTVASALAWESDQPATGTLPKP
ncbi:hypothetical protein [Streptacidiphilus cavernicola]|uniref:Uncharacterized protein n=1 Tax=Streptacidiphilus cavernicola TaxID=3342716 RepID=A0ABV6W4T6_9ACTN